MIKAAFFPGIDKHGQHVFPLHNTRTDALFEKIAAPTLLPDVLDYIDQLTPQDNSQYALLNAMAAGEYFGSNINGDWFPEEALIHKPDTWTGIPEFDRVLAQSWPYGFPTFYNAGVFAHHRNKDMTKSFGAVELASWHPDMKRVELVIRLDKEPCYRFGGTGLWDKLAAGQMFDVSMGCFTRGNLVTMADGTRKPIEQVQVGDLVLTHLGNSKKVTETHRRQYAGPLYHIRVEAHETVTATMQHPFWCVPDEQVKTQDSLRRWKGVPELDPEWVDAQDLEAHHLLEPVVEEVLTPDYVDKAFCRLFGYYLAEGHVLRNKKKEIVGVEFSVHKDDLIHEEIEELCRQFGTRNGPVWHDRPHSERAQGIYVFDEKLAKLCYEHGGGYAQKKRMSYAALRWHPDAQREILGAYANGDGTASATGTLKLSTSSTDLAWQWMAVLPRLSILASIQSLEHKAGNGFNKHVTYEWVIHIGKQWAQGLRDVCGKVQEATVLKAKNSRKIVGGYVVTPLRSLEVEETTTEVFNLEVEDDASYLVAGLAVHNCKVPFDTCSICLDWKLYREAQATFDPGVHKHPGQAVLEFHRKLIAQRGQGIRGLAITRKDYCVHAKTMMNRIFPDGRRVFVYNDFPRFFDISGVFIGADKTAKAMLKIAEAAERSYHFFWSRPSAEVAEDLGYTEGWSEKAAAAVLTPQQLADDLLKQAFMGKGAKLKRAEITKDVVPSQFAASAVPLLTHREPSLSNDLLDRLAKKPMRDVLSTSGGLGMVMRPREFQRLMLSRLGLGREADDLDRRNIVFPRVEEEEEVGLSKERFSPLIAKLLQPFFDSRSSFGPAVEKRVTIIMVGGRGGKNRPASQLSPLLHKIGAAYNGYRKSLMQFVPEAVEVGRQTGAPEELHKCASVPVDQLFTPLSVAYVKHAYWDEVGINQAQATVVGVERDYPRGTRVL